MTHARVAAIGLACLLLGGCGGQTALLGTTGSYVLTGMDALTPPGTEVDLRAQLRQGDFLQGAPGQPLRFRLDGRLYKAVETDQDGTAYAAFTPPAPGNYRFAVEVVPVGLPGDPPDPTEIVVACRSPDAPLVIVDMDKTIVATGFQTVLFGSPRPMERSQEVLSRLAQDHTIVYLTHRPDLFGLKSKRWLRDNQYPPGPVLLSTIGGFLKGSGAFKSGMLEQIRRQFTNVRIGIGDKISDAQTYHEHHMRSILIVEIPKADAPQPLEALAAELDQLDPAVQVVAHWSQVGEILDGRGDYSRPRMQEELRRLAAQAGKAPR